MKKEQKPQKVLKEEIQFLRRRIKELEDLIVHDTLSGLYSNTYFKNRLSSEIDRANRHSRPLSILMMDIDNFKQCNDQYGHVEGDCLIVEISRVLKNESRKADVVCRYAGDEFAIILPETDGEQAKCVAQKIKKFINELKIKCTPSVSIGVAEYLNHMGSIDLIKKADQALYKAKEEGKNKIYNFVETQL